MAQEIPGWVVTFVGLASFFQIFSAIALTVCGAIMAYILWQIKGAVFETKDMLEKEVRKDLLPSVTATVKNVERISTDAADTTHNVTGAVNRVSNLVGTAAERLESPVVRAVGLASGLVAASRAAKAATKEDDKAKKKKKGKFFG